MNHVVAAQSKNKNYVPEECGKRRIKIKTSVPILLSMIHKLYINGPAFI